MNTRGILLVLWWMGMANFAVGQCCSGGTGSPIAGGASQGVLSDGQIEINSNFQYIHTEKFFSGDQPAENKYFDRYRSGYLYTRLAYGLSEKLTVSADLGYYLFKEEIGLNNDPFRTYRSAGISDMIIFPRYEIYHRRREGRKTEFTAGLGIKIPLGSYQDSTGNVEPFSGMIYYVRNPVSVQVTSGAIDAIFYLFFLQGYPNNDLKWFANFFYIRKGWNPMGEKLGDFASLALFASRELWRDVSLTLQLRGEWNDRMSINRTVWLYNHPSYDPLSTGYKKVFITPQLNIVLGRFITYGLIDIPIYQFLTKTQAGSGLQAGIGISYRFYPTFR